MQQQTEDLPHPDGRGNLPVGTYKLPIEVVIEQLGGRASMRRYSLGKKLHEFFTIIKPFSKAIYIDGSFVTSKLSPNDVDVFLILSNRERQNPDLKKILLSYMKTHDKLHIQLCYETDFEKIAGWLNFFTTTRVDETGHQFQKGIIELELKND